MSDTTTRPNDLQPNFSDALRVATSAQHGNSEGVPFLGTLMAGKLPLGAYADMSAQMVHIYAALESPSLQASLGESAAPFMDQRLKRSAALLDDVAFLAGANWAETHTPTESTLAYSRSILETESADHLYVAHHYTRYLGDLSGGQHIGHVLCKAFDLVAGTGGGASFYDFSELGDLTEFKDAYRSSLDNAAWTDSQRDELIAAVASAYEFNDSVMADLWERWVESR